MIWAWTVAAMTAAFLYYLTVRVDNVQLGYELGRERTLERELTEQRRLLMLETAALRQPDRVELVARSTLGMDSPKSSAVIAIGAGPIAQRISGRVR